MVDERSRRQAAQGCLRSAFFVVAHLEARPSNLLDGMAAGWFTQLMAKVFRSWDVDQGWLLPPWLHEFVPAGHIAHFVRDTVREALDRSAILETYTEERGYPPYHPGMIVALLLYGCSRGLYSSGQLARACEERSTLWR